VVLSLRLLDQKCGAAGNDTFVPSISLMDCLHTLYVGTYLVTARHEQYIRHSCLMVQLFQSRTITLVTLTSQMQVSCLSHSVIHGKSAG